MIKSENKSRINEDICVLATPDNHSYSYLFDCGVASRLKVAEIMRVRAVFVTHTHVDHFINFDAIIRNRAGSKDPITITGPQGIARNVQGKLNAYTWNLIGKSGSGFEIREIVDDHSFKLFRLCPPRWKIEFIAKVNSEPLFSQDKISVRHCVLDHKIPSIAYLMQEENSLNIMNLPYRPGPWIQELKKAFRDGDHLRQLYVDDHQVMARDLFHTLQESQGYRLGYAMDHLGGGPNHEKLKIFFQGIEELYIESFFRHVDWSYAKKHKHCTSYLSGKLAREAGVQKLNLVHHSRRYHEEIPDLLEEGIAAFEGRLPLFQLEAKPRFSDLHHADQDL